MLKSHTDLCQSNAAMGILYLDCTVRGACSLYVRLMHTRSSLSYVDIQVPPYIFAEFDWSICELASPTSPGKSRQTPPCKETTDAYLYCFHSPKFKSGRRTNSLQGNDGRLRIVSTFKSGRRTNFSSAAGGREEEHSSRMR
jgi:hypothetical protein